LLAGAAVTMSVQTNRFFPADRHIHAAMAGAARFWQQGFVTMHAAQFTPGRSIGNPNLNGKNTQKERKAQSRQKLLHDNSSKRMNASASIWRISESD